MPDGLCGADLMAALEPLAAYVIGEIPRRPGPVPGGEPGDAGRGQRAAALTAAYHAAIATPGCPGTVAFGWVRSTSDGPVRVVTAGDALAGGAAGPDGEVLLALPAGARGRPLDATALGTLIGGLGRWRPVAGISDSFLAAGSSGGDRGASGATGRSRVSLDDMLLGSWTGAFGWLAIAEPVPPARLLALAEEAGRRQRIAEAAADRFPEQALLARRLSERHAELQRGMSDGFWRITVAAGGTSAANAARVAGLLCAAADLSGLPYALSPAEAPMAAPHPADLDPGGDATAAAPCYGSTGLLASLARPPEAEVPGVRFPLRPEFDVTPETPDAAADGIRLGEVLDRNLRAAGPFTVAAGSLNRHVFVCGATGAGKSQTVRCLLEAATERGIPWLVVEPAKAEYRLMANRLPGAEVIRIRPGEPDAIAAGLNPLEPAGDGNGGRFPLQTHADLVKALFIASFQAEEPFPQVLGAALGRVYEERGWDLALGEPSRSGEAAYPTLTDLQRAAERVVTEIGYSQRVTDDVLGFIRVRLASLRHGTTGRFLEGGHPLDFGALLRSNVVLEIEDVGDDADKAFLMGTVLIRLAEHLRLSGRTAGPAAPALAHLTVVEEAHRLLRRAEPGGTGRAGGAGAGAHAVELFAGLLAEIRAYGEGLVIAEQIPARLLPDVIKNTAVKITHRLPAADDREAVGATMNATQAQSGYLVTLPPGQAAVFCDGMDFPVLVKIEDGTERELASPAPTADPRGVVRPRSGTCGGECARRPCTLRDMRAAQRLLGELPWTGLWAELAVLAHLTGWQTPVPLPGTLAELRARPPRVAHCALSHAVDAAVAARLEVARPHALASHVADVLFARADRGEWRCPAEEPEWLLPAGQQPGPLTRSAGSEGKLLGAFIDCQWPRRFLPPQQD